VRPSARGGGSGYAPLHTGAATASRSARSAIATSTAQPKPEAALRGVPGDSFTWGSACCSTTPGRSGSSGRVADARRALEAVNLAEPGMNAVQYASRLESEGWGYGPTWS
jgi:hypothetical protein